MLPKGMKNVTLPRESALHMNASCASWNLRRAARVVTRHYNQALRGSGVTAEQLPLLSAIAASDEFSVGTLAEALDIERSAVSRDVSVLEKKGFVRLLKDPRDARITRLAITAKGHRALAVAFEAWKTAHSELQSVVGDKDLAHAIRQIKIVGRAAKKLGNPE